MAPEHMPMTSFGAEERKIQWHWAGILLGSESVCPHHGALLTDFQGKC